MTAKGKQTLSWIDCYVVVRYIDHLAHGGPAVDSRDKERLDKAIRKLRARANQGLARRRSGPAPIELSAPDQGVQRQLDAILEIVQQVASTQADHAARLAAIDGAVPGGDESAPIPGERLAGSPTPPADPGPPPGAML